MTNINENLIPSEYFLREIARFGPFNFLFAPLQKRNLSSLSYISRQEIAVVVSSID